MSMDGMMIYALVHELQQNLTSGRISKIYQPDDRDLILHIRANRTNHKLLISANPSYPRLHFTEESLDNPKQAPMFCMIMRKYMEGGFIENIEQVGTERIIHIDVRFIDELGDTASRRLIIELMGRHSNIILADPHKQTILDSIVHISHAQNHHRAVLPGQPYIAPPEQNKANPLTTDADTFTKKMNMNAGQLDQQIVQSFSGISPLLAKEIVHLAGIGEREKLTQSFLNVTNRISKMQFEPCIIQASTKTYFYLFPLEHLRGDIQFFNTFSAMLTGFFQGKAERDRVKQRAHDMFRLLNNERKKNMKKIVKLKQTIADSELADQQKLYGELLTAYMHQINRGDKQVEVVNYYDENGATITIPLDTQRTPNENAQQYFKKYHKLNKSKIEAQKQIRKTQAEMNYFDTILQQLDQDISPTDIEEIREELVEGGYLRRRMTTSKKKKKKKKEPQLSIFQSSEGISIYVGKNNKQNDYLTSRLAKPTDTWLHTKNIPGSHVVIRQENYSEQTLLEAAQIAAYYSKAGQSAQVPVDYTQVRHVRKTNGARPGYVIYDNQQTVYVTPSGEEINRLKPS